MFHVKHPTARRRHPDGSFHVKHERAWFHVKHSIGHRAADGHPAPPALSAPIAPPDDARYAAGHRRGTHRPVDQTDGTGSGPYATTAVSARQHQCTSAGMCWVPIRCRNTQYVHAW